MATTQDGTHLTRWGFELLAKALAGKELHFTRAKLGDSMRDGEMIQPTREEQYEFDDLINPREFLNPDEAPFISIDRIGGGMVSVQFAVRSANIPEGFYNRELGLFAQDPDTGDEHLYCYCNNGEFCEWVPDSSATNVYDVIQSIITVIQEAANVTAVIDGGLAYVTQAEFKEHVNAEKPHPNAPCIGAEVTTTNYFWAQDDDINLHPLSTANARRLILQGDAADIPKIDRRLTQTEINISNLLMQLNAEREIGLEPNLTLVEDFANTDTIDTYTVQVLAQGAGVAEVVLETDEGIISGAWYTITDGLQSEFVQVRSVIKNPTAIIAVLEQILNNTYNLANTWLMRSTARIIDGYATGAGDLRGKTYNFVDTWQGTGADTTVTQVLNTTQSNLDNFDISGDYAFTYNGEFTLAPMIPNIFDNSNVRVATAVTVMSAYGDFGILTNNTDGPGTEYYTSLKEIHATKHDSTFYGGKNSNRFIFIGGESNVATGGLGADTFAFNSCGGTVNDFGINSLRDIDKTYAKTPNQIANDTYYAYSRDISNGVYYAEGNDVLTVDGTVTAIKFSGHGDESTSANREFNVDVTFTDPDGASHVVHLLRINKPLDKKVYVTDDEAALELHIIDYSTGEAALLTKAQLQILFTN